MGTVHGPVVVSALHTGFIRLNLVSLLTIPGLMVATTGKTSEKGGECSRLELSTQPHYFSSLEKRFQLAFNADSQGNVVHSHTGYDISGTGIDYGIVCLRPYPQDFEFVGYKGVVLMGQSGSN